MLAPSGALYIFQGAFQIVGRQGTFSLSPMPQIQNSCSKLTQQLSNEGAYPCPQMSLPDFEVASEIGNCVSPPPPNTSYS